MLQSLDPYSSYMSPENFRNMNAETKGEFGGLGIEITMQAGLVKVISPIEVHQLIRLVLKLEIS